jgi:dCMP deaminase
MKQKFIDYYMDVAERTGKLSYAIRRQVGAVIVKDNRILSYGYNGMPTGWDNQCEYKDYMSSDAGGWLNPDEIEERWPLQGWREMVAESGEVYGYNARYRLVTKDEVLHAESNAIAKVSGSTESSEDATLFVTTAPCIHCAKMIFQSGIKSVYYRDSYRDSAGIDFLTKGGVNVIHYDNDKT